MERKRTGEIDIAHARFIVLYSLYGVLQLFKGMMEGLFSLYIREFRRGYNWLTRGKNPGQADFAAVLLLAIALFGVFAVAASNGNVTGNMVNNASKGPGEDQVTGGWTKSTLSLSVQGRRATVGLVDSKRGKLLEGQTINLSRDNATISLLETGKQGTANYQPLPPGDYDLTASYPGNDSRKINGSSDTDEISVKEFSVQKRSEQERLQGKVQEFHVQNFRDKKSTVALPVNDSSSLSIRSGKTDFRMGENPSFEGSTPSRFTVSQGDKKKDFVRKDVNGDGRDDKLEFNVSGGFNGTVDVSRQRPDIEARVTDSSGASADIQPEVVQEGDGYRVDIPRTRGVKPGVYELHLETPEGNMSTEFTWGLISINTKKSIYRPGEMANIYMVVLDSEGYLVSGADVSLNVTSPSGETKTFSTSEDTVRDSYIREGVYDVRFLDTEEAGNYTMTATARHDEEDVRASITSKFAVREDFAFDIVRDFPFTLDPRKGPYTGKISTTSYTQDSNYTVREKIPADFNVTEPNGASVTTEGDTKILEWEGVSNKSEVKYKAQVPEIWPYLYRLGKAEIDYDTSGGTQTFTEFRNWQLAVDPVAGYFTDSVDWSAVANNAGGTSSTQTWTPNTNCTEAAGTTAVSNCYLSRINFTFAATNTGNSPADAYASIDNNGGTTYYPASYSIADNTAFGPLSSCGYNNNAVNNPTSPITCNLGIGDDFTGVEPSFTTVVNLPATSGSVSVGAVTYEWTYDVEAPQISEVNATAGGTGTGGWGETWNFSAKVYDAQGGNVDVYAWTQNPLTGNWKQVGAPKTISAPTTSSNAQLVSITDKPFNYTDINPGWATKVNATDSSNNAGEAFGPEITVTEDEIDILHWAGNNTLLDRGDLQADTQNQTTLKVRTNDTDNQTWILDGILHVVEVDANPSVNESSNVLSDTGGFTNFTIDPKCSPEYAVGQVRARVTTGGGAPYFGDEERWFYFDITDQLQPTVDRPTGGVRFDQKSTDTIYINTSVETDCGAEPGVSTWFNVSGPGNNHYRCPETGYNTTSAGGEAACIFNVSDASGKPEGDYNITVHSNKTDFIEGD
ncbi:MAG: hypothetical protein MUP63_01745, partial [Candidatus Nanohaloarchaeota archaeon QJJ-7]|nr:hypothetical protein [Candidatus Nanohaloarchaeota archaeon QJJ-7]